VACCSSSRVHMPASFLFPLTFFGGVAVHHSCCCVWPAVLDAHWAFFMDCFNCGECHCCAQGVWWDELASTCVHVLFPPPLVGMGLGRVLWQEAHVGPQPCQVCPCHLLLLLLHTCALLFSFSSLFWGSGGRHTAGGSGGSGYQLGSSYGLS
jgi:hypothetical protein